MKKISLLLFIFLLVSVSVDAQKRRKRVRAKSVKTVKVIPQPTASNHALAIGANSWKAIPVYVNISKRISGRFYAQGGGRNDIEVFILDADGLTNFSNGNATPTYYNSDGGKTVGNFDRFLTRGVYYIVFKNSAIMHSKAVTLELLEYPEVD